MHAQFVERLQRVWRCVFTMFPPLRRPIGLLLILSSLLVSSGCSRGKPSTVNTGGAQISADPNPVPAGSEKFGKTTVSWDTGDGSIGEVYISINGGPEKLFAGNRSKSSLEASWIGKGDHEFRLYAGKEHKTMLASVKVTRSR